MNEMGESVKNGEHDFLRVGIDVGGTNTDAAVVKGRRILGAHKTTTTTDISTGVCDALKGALDRSKVAPGALEAVMVGTTSFTNAVIEREGLARTAVIRICLPANRDFPPLMGWPRDLSQAINASAFMIAGGYEIDGRQIAPLDENAIAEAARNVRSLGIRHVAVSCMFAPANSELEHRASHIIKNEIPDVQITVSSDVGTLGLLDRENAAILNAALGDLAHDVTSTIESALESMDVTAPLYMSRNDGTLMKLDYMRSFPILTIASGPTNSLRGGALLAGVSDAVVVDIGGTTTDVGVVRNNFPIVRAMPTEFGGVRTNFRTPDIFSFGLGGGSLVTLAPKLRIGPKSVKSSLTDESIVFGGDTLTATDIAVAIGRAELGDPSRLARLPTRQVEQADKLMQQMVMDAIDGVTTTADPLPIVVVGGGHILVGEQLNEGHKVTVPDYANVANALGAAIAQVSGEHDQIFSLLEIERDAAIAIVVAKAREKAVAAGASSESLEIAETDIIPLAYSTGKRRRIRVKVVGELARK